MGEKKLFTIQNPTEVRLEALSFKDFDDPKPAEINKAGEAEAEENTSQREMKLA